MRGFQRYHVGNGGKEGRKRKMEWGKKEVREEGERNSGEGGKERGFGVGGGNKEKEGMRQAAAAEQ